MKFILCALICTSMPAWAFTAVANKNMDVMTMMSAITATSTSSVIQPSKALMAFQAKGTTTAGAGAATIKIEGSNTNSAVDADWVLLGTITLTLGTTSTGDGFTKESPWPFVRARVTAISGTNATVYVYASSMKVTQ